MKLLLLLSKREKRDVIRHYFQNLCSINKSIKQYNFTLLFFESTYVTSSKTRTSMFNLLNLNKMFYCDRVNKDRFCLVDNRDRVELYEAAQIIQHAFRLYKKRQRLLRQIEEEKQHRQAAVVIQSYYRRYKQVAVADHTVEFFFLYLYNS
uniref:Calmodulin binding transcription activator 2 n=1 Tax=Syphacia muris TaxID=451379 RepID=A0A0N5AP04_9BILA